jgi:hypothetical protein
LDLLLEPPEPCLDADHLVDPIALGGLRHRALSSGTLQPGEGVRKRRVAVDHTVFRHDRQAMEGRNDHHPQRLRMLRGEVVERSRHAVPGTAFMLGVGHVAVEPPVADQPRPTRAHTCSPVGVPELLRNAVGFVVLVTPPIGPANLVEDQHGQCRACARGSFRSEPKLVEDGEPIVVTVDQYEVGGGQRRKDVVARPLVEVVSAGKPAPIFPRIELCARVDDVQVTVGAQAGKPPGGLTWQCSDRDDAPCAHRVDHRCYDFIPQGDHPSQPFPRWPRRMGP